VASYRKSSNIGSGSSSGDIITVVAAASGGNSDIISEAGAAVS